MPEHDLPEAIGRYRPLKLIGSGGMGRVYLALDDDGRTVAVKSLYPHVAADETARLRLLREVQTMRRIRSSRVAHVLDADLGAASPYVVTHYIQGRSLADNVTAGGPLDGAALHRLARGLARALADIHTVGCVHRDLKPANVMIVEGEPIVIDFGISHEVGASRATRQGAMGTPGYMAPEVINREPIGPAADVFTWAATVVYAATGRHAFAGPTPEAMAWRTVKGEPDLDGVGTPLRFLLADALAVDPADRPDAAELVRRLDGREGQPRTALRLERGPDGPRLAGYRELAELSRRGPLRRVRARAEPGGATWEIRYVQGARDDPERVRLRTEARLLRRIASPHLQATRDFVEDHDCAALVVEEASGRPLSALLAAGDTYSPDEALALLEGSLRGLSAVHRAGLVHCGYTPSHIVVGPAGESSLTGLGAAVTAGAASGSGEPLYMAPEQWAREPLTAASDVYAASCVLFHCVSGRAPFWSDDTGALSTLHQQAAPPLGEVPEPLRGLLARGLAKHPAYRPPDAGSWLGEIRSRLTRA